ncbi:MAG TPA: NUDIX domain-containing protein [Candidatus Paceibacterota bacterium]|nr:NUDIX domain-containing protein [Candidatus Paceibacterota bacterium]
MSRVTRSAGGIVLGNSGDIALVRNRIDTKWFFPKGRLEEGEDDETAARREIAEETGITDLEHIADLGSYARPRIGADGEYREDELKDIHMYLFAAPMYAELSPSMEIAEACWVPYREVAERLEDAKDRAWYISVFERVREAVQRD